MKLKGENAVLDNIIDFKPERKPFFRKSDEEDNEEIFFKKISLYMKHPAFYKIVKSDIHLFEDQFSSEAKALAEIDILPRLNIDDTKTLEILNIFEKNPRVKTVVWNQLHSFSDKRSASA